MAKKRDIAVANVQNRKDAEQIAAARAYYESHLKEGVETGELTPFITYRSVPENFDLRHVRYNRTRSNDFEVYDHLNYDVAKLTDEDFDAILAGGKVARMNYGFLPQDAGTLAGNLKAAEIDTAAKDREISELKKQLAALDFATATKSKSE